METPGKQHEQEAREAARTKVHRSPGRRTGLSPSATSEGHPDPLHQIPYMAHILAVAAIALEFGATEDEAIAAILHDAIEDAPEELGPTEGDWARRMIGFKFGPEVLAMVEANTDADIKRKPSWRQRKERYIESIAHKAASEILVSAADKLHNARAVLADYRVHREKVWGRFNKEAGQRGHARLLPGAVNRISGACRGPSG
jgi:(p)ppGpp synthase/HD superfamily hydrolase